MACETCGNSSYDTNSTADFFYVVTVSGDRVCATPGSIAVYGMPYVSTGVWKKLRPGQFRVERDCGGSGGWTFQLDPGTTVGLPTPNCEEIPISETYNVGLNDCENFQLTHIRTYSDGSWVRVDITIVINRNDACA